jgi:cytochrome c peroxidase
MVMGMQKIVAGFVLCSVLSILMTGCGGDSSRSKIVGEPIATVPEACKDFTNTETVAITGIENKALLGKKLFLDKNLSKEGNQSCATCHNPDKGLIDDRPNISSNGSAPAGSVGDDLVSIGDRNAPTAAYAAFSPHFKCGVRARVASQKTSGIEDYEGFIGGQFWDGREDNLAGQAGGPPTNPGEMNMPSKAAVVERLKENAEYVTSFETLYAADIFDDVEIAYAAMAESIAAFETLDKEEFYPFDSKYDRSLLVDIEEDYFDYGTISPAATGKTRFFSSDLTCAACHQLRPIGDQGEIFTSFEYHNIGLAENKALRLHSKAAELDGGLLNNAKVTKETEKGKFKVPTLRNVAVTAPYMHNGIFNELETVIHFYQHAKEKALNIKTGATIDLVDNPETNLPWGDAEINENIEHDLLGGNDINLDDDEVKAMVCFLMSLTDKRYEHLLDQNKARTCGLL